MKKIVDEPIKIDLHIHSIESAHKDGKKVANNTIENIPVLISKLKENGIDMCAITDHDRFGYSMYRVLKSHEGNELQKVLPGVEFSVNFDGKKVIHIVTIFDDSNDEKVKNIEKILNEGSGKEKYKDGAFSRDDYFLILKEIDLDFVMIAHQKKSPTSTQKPHKSDVLSLGRDKFNELLFLEYFDAYEFRQRDNEVFNKKYSIDHDVKDKMRFVTGSDCHDWKWYPNSGDKKDEIGFTYLKALPTFKGLVMAITDNHRINYSGSFWGQGKYVKELRIKINGKTNVVPMSRGINVIIGDNSIGKSLLLHELTSEREISSNTKLKRGYEKYISDNGIEILTKIDEKEIFKFNYQGQIREIFEDVNLKADKYLAEFFPTEINAGSYRKPVEREFNRLYKLIEKRFEYEDSINQLLPLSILDEDELEKELVLGIELETIDISELQKLVEKLEAIIDELTKEIIPNKALEEGDKERLQSEVEYFELIHKKYSDKYEKAKLERTKRNAFNTALKRFKRKYSERQTDAQNRHNAFAEDRKILAENISNLVKTRLSFEDYKCQIDETIVKPEVNPVDTFLFVSKIMVEKVDEKYINEVISSVLKRDPNRLDTAIEFLEWKFHLPGDGAYRTGNFGIDGYTHRLDDLCHHPTMVGLVCCVIVQFTGNTMYVNKLGEDINIPIVVNEYGNFVGNNTVTKLFAGVINWFITCAKTMANREGHLMSDVATSASLPGSFLSMMTELASIPCFRNEQFLEDLRKAFKKGIGTGKGQVDLGVFNSLFEGAQSKLDITTEKAVVHELKRQALPIVINEVLVRGAYFIRRFINELKEKQDVSDIEWNKVIPFNNRTIVRMMTIATGTFTAVDMADAAIHAAPKSVDVTTFLSNMILRVNFVGVGRFAIAVTTDAGMGVARSVKRNNRIKLQEEQLLLLDAKVSYKQADMWISAEKAGETIEEAYNLMEKSTIEFADSYNDIKESLYKINDSLDLAEEKNPGLKADLSEALKWG